MRKKVFRADARGLTNEHWLVSKHSFSFGSFFDVERMAFGALRVLNDDWVAPDTGFDTHPHKNMEIVTLVLSGSLEHKDSTGSYSVLHEGEAQVMSAGTGILHSEKNHSQTHPVEFLQIWIVPKTPGGKPSHKEMTLDMRKKNVFVPIATADGEKDSLVINQRAYLYLGTFEKGAPFGYRRHEYGNGMYFLVLDGALSIAGEEIGTRDAIGIWEIDSIKGEIKENSTVLIIEVPMAI